MIVGDDATDRGQNLLHGGLMAALLCDRLMGGGGGCDHCSRLFITLRPEEQKHDWSIGLVASSPKSLMSHIERRAFNEQGLRANPLWEIQDLPHCFGNIRFALE
jgi:hypothetical protein